MRIHCANPHHEARQDALCLNCAGDEVRKAVAEERERCLEILEGQRIQWVARAGYSFSQCGAAQDALATACEEIRK